MKHYLAIFVENNFGEWRVVFPDMPGCEARSFSLDDAGIAATSALTRCLRENGTPPLPMDLAAVQQHREWLELNHIDLSKAVVTMIQLAG
jgi:predicted RNase H-like HicB family nuclease